VARAPVSLDIPIDAGAGPAVVLLHGFAMRPATYRGLVDLLAARCRVIVPDLFAWRGRWRYQAVVDAFTTALDGLRIERATLLGHSFGGGIELGFAARSPDRVTELVFSDTLADAREWGLSREALRHPSGILRLATPAATTAFALGWATHPRQLVDAAWWAFRSNREGEREAVADAGIRAHVLWANRDSILDRADGIRFAEELHATFTVGSRADGGPIDHDWMFQQPELFYAHLEKLPLVALSP
jgi:pimeloyl-ACP methyl ester carboxylesterase